MSTIALVSTQMQLVNCIEFLFKFNKRIDQLVVLCHSMSRHSQLEMMLDKPEVRVFFEKIQFIDLEKQGFKGIVSQYACRKKISVIAKQDVFTEFVIGNNFPIQNRFFIQQVAQHCPLCKFYVCDDGLASLSSYDNRIMQLQDKVCAYPVNSKVLKCVYMFSGVDKFIPREYTYFTIYNLKDNHVDKYIKNPYMFIRTHPHLFNHEFIVDDFDTVFLGQPLLQQRLLDLVGFNTYLRYVVNGSSRDRVLYVAHPQEKIEQCSFDDDLRNRITIVRFDYPIEAFISMLETKQIYSFFTSAMVTLKYMSPTINLYSIWVKEIMDKGDEYSERVGKVYEYLLSNEIPVIHVRS